MQVRLPSVAIAESAGPAPVASVEAQGMAAQTALLPYALAAFGICLPVFVWVASHAANAAWMSVSFAVFAIGWGAFFAAVNWLRSPGAADLRRRARVQILAGLIWSMAIVQLAVFAEGSGPPRETLLLLTLGAAMISLVFTAPWLPSLLIVAPVALAGPMIALFSRPEDLHVARLAMAGAALALALALLVNRILRTQFALAAEREALILERGAQAEAARRLARSKSDLVSTLSDEIRNGLAGVAHVLASAAGRGRAAPTRQQVSAALEAVNDLLAILDTTVDAESAEAGHLSVESRPIDLIGLARELVALSRPAAAAKGLDLGLHLDEGLIDGAGAAVADPARVRQVLDALIGNAVKFTLRGRVEVRIGRVGADRIFIAVADTGPGLSEDDLVQALQPFQRVARTSAGSSGAGLGLPLAMQLTRLMGGALRAEGAPGIGSCFTLELPFDPAARPETARQGPGADAPARRLRILTVEPDALSAAMLRASLEQLGHQVVHAGDGARAVDLARVCDLDLVVASEATTIAALRNLPGSAGLTPAIALTAGDADEADSARAAGAHALLRRPVSVPAAARAIGEALSAKPLANDRAIA